MNGVSERAAGAASLYAHKEAAYFEGCRTDYVSALPENAEAAILEVGCGTGATGELALRLGKCGQYCGIELVPAAADVARERLTEVVVGDAEVIDLPWSPASFDALIMSEVLEHLRDPWAVLRRLHAFLRPGARVFASTPNAAHKDIIAMLVRGRWDLASSGPMDRTHLRWFTPASLESAFVDAAYVVDSVGPLGSLGPKSRVVDALLLGRAHHLLHRQIDLRAHVPQQGEARTVR